MVLMTSRNTESIAQMMALLGNKSAKMEIPQPP
jgi:hypothetical protein